MIIHGDTLISEDIFERQFICNLNHCKGACCIEGDFGAPLQEEEIELINKNLEKIKPYLNDASIDDINERNFWELDSDKDLVTTCLPTGECNFSKRDENGILSCGIEQAWKDGNSDFRKPISCHLYPIRVSKVGNYDALNYHRWDVCNAACELGKAEGVEIYKFLKDALVRAYGAEWYNELVEIAKAIK